MKTNTTLLLACMIATITACGGDNKSSDSDTDSPSSSTTKFDQLVNDMFADTSNTAIPVNTNQLTIEFNHDEANFDNLF